MNHYDTSFGEVDLNDKAKVLELAQSIRRGCKSSQAESIGLLHTAIVVLEMLDTPGRDAEHHLSELYLARFFYLRWDADLANAFLLLSKSNVCH